MKRLVIIGFSLLSFLLFTKSEAQQLNGMRGSVYTPVINQSVQPAAAEDMREGWALEVVGIDVFGSNNIVKGSPLRWERRDDTLLMDPQLVTGEKRHKAVLSGDLQLFHFLIRLKNHKSWVLGAGWDIHSNTVAHHLDYDYENNMNTVSQFLLANAIKYPQKGLVVNQQWNEWYISASKVLRENNFRKITLGARAGLIRGIGAGFINIRELKVRKMQKGGGGTLITDVGGQYGYSENLDNLSDAETTKDYVNSFTDGSPFSASLDLGITYTRKKPVYIVGFTNDQLTDYKWKLSLSLTNFGRLKYPLGKGSRRIEGAHAGVTVEQIHRLLNQDLSNDNLNRVLELEPREGTFSVSLPAAFHVGFDRNLNKGFFVHAQLGLDASFLVPGVDFRSRVLNYLTITPRWEKKHFGAYVPLYVNDMGQFLAGAAVRLGPVVAGVHDFKWLFGRAKSAGAYLSIVFKGLFEKGKRCPAYGNF